MFAEMKAIRHTFPEPSIALIDAYIGRAMLFDVYYRQLASTAFARLDKGRKKAVISAFEALAREIAALSTSMLEHDESLRDIARQTDLRALLAR